MDAGSGRWNEVSPSRYPHERAGLEHVREHLPDVEPYRAWSNLEVTALDGTPHEIDLLVCGPVGLYVVELKAWSGRIARDEHEWYEANPSAGRTITRRNPLPLVG